MLPNTLGVALKVCNLGLLQIARGPLAAVRWVTMHAALMNCRRVMTLLASWSEFECPTDTVACAMKPEHRHPESLSPPREKVLVHTHIEYHTGHGEIDNSTMILLISFP